MSLLQTHPDYIYVVLQGAGIISEGRPIRGNFWCYKLHKRHTAKVEKLFTKYGSESPEVIEFVSRQEVKWSQVIDNEGREW